MISHLLLMRHAKSAWDDPSLLDHQRPLNKRGRRAADAVARALTARGYAPDIIWASDAARTSETAKRVIRIIPGAQTIHRSSELYHASAPSMLHLCRKSGEPEGRLMLLGHNPGMGELFAYLSGQNHDFPTGCCAVFKRVHDGDWLERENWHIIDLILPRELEPRP